MQIILQDIGKRYNAEWIFRQLDYTFEPNQAYAILGSNGSGKSTLLQLLSGMVRPSKGEISYALDGNEVPIEQVFRHITLATPYLQLPEDFTLLELIDFQTRFKAMRFSDSPKQIVDRMSLGRSANKQIKYYSSGMRQRVKLGMAIFADSPLLLLDEPTSNLDHKGIDWYNEQIEAYSQNRLIMVCSNEQKAEYSFCSASLNVEDFKRKRR